MRDDRLRRLAVEAGISVEWTDNTGEHRVVGVESLRAMLVALGMACGGDHEVAESRARLARERSSPLPPPLVTATVDEAIRLPLRVEAGQRALLEFEQGGARGVSLEPDGEGARLPPVSRPGYHRLSIAGYAITLAVAPRRAFTVEDIAPGEKLWGLTAQIYGLRRAGDGGIGDFGAVAQLARRAAGLRADALSLSPTHALFSADRDHFTPYSPSSRLFHNALLADPAAVFDEARIAGVAAQKGANEERARLAALDLVDWPAASGEKAALLRGLFDSFRARELAQGDHPLALDFGRFRKAGGQALERHAVFETLHANQFRRDFTKWRWRTWPGEFRDCSSPAALAFAAGNVDEVAFHVFLQWLADRSLGAAQDAALSAGMRIGLISDLAVGMNDSGSHAWSSPRDILLGLSIGAPPDPLAPRGQNWGLAAFSPRALALNGYAPYLATLRAALRHAGGVRIDHVMGLARLWLTPDGMDASQGAYLAFPARDMIRLAALESLRHRAIVIGEDLGTVPPGLREDLAGAGLYGMKVMQFERHRDGFNPPDWYPADATAMTSTHDTATTAGWWKGVDLETRAGVDQLPPGQALEQSREERARDRGALWNAFRAAGVASGEPPAPDNTATVCDAAVAFLARAPACLALLPLEDALGLVEQPNLPGTTNEHPNWRRRYPGTADACLAAPEVQRRLRPLAER